MGELTLSVFVLVTSAMLCFATLASIYGPIRAYVALCWLPIAAYGVVRLFAYVQYQPAPSGQNVEFLTDAVQWTSFFQGSLGIVLILVALRNGQSAKLLLAATILAILPFLRA